jgi:hypothetical protein
VIAKLIAYPAVALCALAAPIAYVRLNGPEAYPAAAASKWAVESLPGTIVMAGGTFIDEMGQEVVRLAGGEKSF